MSFPVPLFLLLNKVEVYHGHRLTGLVNSAVDTFHKAIAYAQVCNFAR